MRIRTIKPEFFHHEGLFDLERETGLPVRVAFAGLWCAADREGRFKWEARRLGVQILPYDQVDFARVLDALTTRGFIRRYASGTGTFGVIPSFLDHQVINNREKDSELPEPLEYLDPDASVTREPRVDHAGKAEGKGKEGKGKEGNMEGRVPDASSLYLLTQFDQFWAAYPKKTGRGDAEKSWARMRPPLDDVLDALGWQSQQQSWVKEKGQFIPMPSTWINQKRWLDQPTEPTRTDKHLAF
jgi:hypothetical protein